ncbi:endo-1,4-beta-xylanase 5-like [Vicia villosa]|uniref:endo-1,4-beta-xylanase 5-like n=1 Tax=Vicia villosa TaxID=3911 RepID=UPI00273B6B51|nr:endo-1,4-beta-xylanase 5-like [Vicia villosa]
MSIVVLLLCVIILTGFEAEALSYDYSSSVECLAHPEKPLYNGGIIQNPQLNDGLQGWTTFGEAKIEHRESLGNKFVVAHSRKQPYDSVSQKIFLRKGLHYTLSAWIRTTEENVAVTAVVKTSKAYKFGGAIYAHSNCWSMLKGGLIADTTEEAQLYFESNNTSVEIWIDNISLQPFTKKQWMSHQRQSIEKARKRKVAFQAVDEQGNPLSNASISVTLNRGGFPFGCSMNKNILNNKGYQDWFTSRFTVTTFENEMKWYTNEYEQGKDNYYEADGMLQFAKNHNIHVRGHNIIWDDPQYQPKFVYSLPQNQLYPAVNKRVNSIVQRYKGQVIGWDVVNENLHFSYFENKLGNDFTPKVFTQVHDIDPKTTLFLNEYNTIEDSRDGASTPPKYIQKIKEIQNYNKNIPLGIGLEAHFPNGSPNLPYMRASIDALAATGLPIWITEIDVEKQNNQAGYYEQVLREAHSHPKVNGIVTWTGWNPQGCYKMCLVDNNFKNLPGGDVVDKLLREWGNRKLTLTTDQNGLFETSLFHGDYELEITHPTKKNYSLTHKVQVHSNDESKATRQLIQLSI